MDAVLPDPSEFAKIASLELVSSRVVDGLFAGKHRSKVKGGCAEFAEHRAYSPGDEVRLLDWRVFAKRDRYYIRQYEEQINLQALFVVDASGSMSFALSAPSKFECARRAAAVLARLILQQRDSAGLAMCGAEIRHFIPPRSQAQHLQVIGDALRLAKPAGETSLARSLQDLSARIRRRGLIAMFSDCFEDLEPLDRSFRLLRARGHDLILFHVLAPEELTFSFGQWSRFESLESDGEKLDLDPAAIRAGYLEELQSFLSKLKHLCGECGCDYVPISTGQPLGETLALYLNQRSRRIR